MIASDEKPRRPQGSRRKTAASKRALDRQTIIDAALAEIDAKGWGAFNLRNLAARLGVYPTAIYWYVPTKNHLMAEVVAEVFRNLAPLDGDADWRSNLHELFVRFRASARRHPNVAPLVGAHLVGNLSIDFDFVEGVLSVLKKAGLRGIALVDGYNAIVAALIGFVTQEFSPIPESGTAGWQSAVQQRLLGVDCARYPVLASHLPLLANKAFILRWENGVEAPLDRSFDSFIEQVIAGIEHLAGRDA